MHCPPASDSLRDWRTRQGDPTACNVHNICHVNRHRPQKSCSSHQLFLKAITGGTRYIITSQWVILTLNRPTCRDEGDAQGTDLPHMTTHAIRLISNTATIASNRRYNSDGHDKMTASIKWKACAEETEGVKRDGGHGHQSRQRRRHPRRNS